MGRKIKIVKEGEGAVAVQAGCTARMLLIPQSVGSKDMDLGILSLEQDCETKPNVHPISEELFYILKGKGKIIVEDEEEDVAVGMGIYIPHNVSHVFVNTGEEPLVFLLMHAPPERKEDLKKSPWREVNK